MQQMLLSCKRDSHINVMQKYVAGYSVVVLQLSLRTHPGSLALRFQALLISLTGSVILVMIL